MDQADRTVLIEIGDSHFAWLMGDAPAPSSDLVRPPGGVDTPEMLRVIRRMTRRLRAAGCRGSWLIVFGGEVVGLCGYKQAPAPDGAVEIGYGVARSRRRRGHATAAVAQMLSYARNDPGVTHVTAATAVANIASQRALERNGFVRCGTSSDPDDGDLILWKTNV
jgi:RimJ/RimL family protein N-acetyltransferase